MPAWQPPHPSSSGEEDVQSDEAGAAHAPDNPRAAQGLPPSPEAAAIWPMAGRLGRGKQRAPRPMPRGPEGSLHCDYMDLL